MMYPSFRWLGTSSVAHIALNSLHSISVDSTSVAFMASGGILSRPAALPFRKVLMTF